MLRAVLPVWTCGFVRLAISLSCERLTWGMRQMFSGNPFSEAFGFPVALVMQVYIVLTIIAVVVRAA